MGLSIEQHKHQNRFLKCDKCTSNMHMTSIFQSGNSIFATYQCDDCMNRVTKCLGVK
ncbi:hypothetical protein JXC34_00305 [Candidatus Woesearchaeota archaeon]|nr:hypothetical protein [Candidatus Woesearchaeota archaeon]